MTKKIICACAAFLLLQVAANAKSANLSKSTQAVLSTKHVIEQLEKWDDNLSSLKAEFRQTVYFRDAGLEKKLSGKIWYKKPDYLKIIHTNKPRQEFVTDKETLWIYKPAEKQVIKAKWKKWLKTQNNKFSGILDFGNYSTILENNEIEMSTGTRKIVLTLKSKKNANLYTLKLFLSAEDFFPQSALLKVKDTEIKTELFETVKNVKIKDKVFRFKPPKNCELIELK